MWLSCCPSFPAPSALALAPGDDIKGKSGVHGVCLRVCRSVVGRESPNILSDRSPPVVRLGGAPFSGCHPGATCVTVCINMMPTGNLEKIN